jgi:hypothetical protein
MANSNAETKPPEGIFLLAEGRLRAIRDEVRQAEALGDKPAIKTLLAEADALFEQQRNLHEVLRRRWHREPGAPPSGA